MQDKGFQPACLFQWLDLIADMTDEIEIEVLQHGGNHHENHVLSHKGKGQMWPSEVIVLYIEVLFACSTLIIKINDVFLDVMMFLSVDVRLLVSIQRYVYITPKISVCCLPSLSFKAKLWENVHNVINSTERSDILVLNCYLCHVRFLLTCYVCSTKIGEISDISKYLENFVSQTLGVLTRIYAAELRYPLFWFVLFL